MLEPQNKTLTHVTARVASSLGELEAAIKARLSAMDAEQYPKRLFDRDASLWSDDPDTQARIQDRLGWVHLEAEARDSIDELTELVSEAHDRGVKHAVLLGMGGSSIAPLVFKEALYEGAPNIDLSVLDTVRTEEIGAVHGLWKKPEHALFIVSSKSGTTLETLSLYEHFRESFPPNQFVAVTDPGSPLEELAKREGFHAVFAAPQDVGGPYGAFSMLGLVPAALMGLKVRRLLDRVKAMHTANFAGQRPCAVRPGLWLGAVVAEAAKAGRDKLTFVISPEIGPLGLWLEQLIAESTGKNGLGIVPVVGESVGAPEAYGDDRLFMHLRLPAQAGSKTEQAVDALEEAGHPVARFYLDDPYDIAAEMLRWQLAVASAGAILGLSPFDEPDVDQRESRTSEILSGFAGEGHLPVEQARVIDGNLAIASDDALPPLAANGSLEDWLAAHLRRLEKGDYAAILAYLPESKKVRSQLRKMQALIRDCTNAATTAAFGPRYLHSTGQLHKEGPKSGVFLMLTTEAGDDLEIPGAVHGFRTLERALAMGDEQALRERGLRVVRCHLGGPDIEKDLMLLRRKLRAALVKATGRP